jgi:hypothetical protein
MNRRPPGGAWRPREESALTPRQTGSRTTPARPTAQASFRFRPRDQLTASLSLPRRMGSGLSRSSKFHSQGVPHSVRGSSNKALKLQRVAPGGLSVSVALQLNA